MGKRMSVVVVVVTLAVIIMISLLAGVNAGAKDSHVAVGTGMAEFYAAPWLEKAEAETTVSYGTGLVDLYSAPWLAKAQAIGKLLQWCQSVWGDGYEW